MTYSYNRLGSNARGSLFLSLRFIRHGKINPGNFRMYGKKCTLEGGEMSSSHEDAKGRGVLFNCHSQGSWSVMNGMPLKYLDKHAPRSCKESTKQNLMCFYRFLRLLGLSRWTKLLIRRAT